MAILTNFFKFETKYQKGFITLKIQKYKLFLTSIVITAAKEAIMSIAAVNDNMYLYSCKTFLASFMLRNITNELIIQVKAH